MRFFLGLAALSTLLSACAREPGVYEMPVEQASALLKEADLTDFRRNRQCGIVIGIDAEDGDGHDVTWRVSSEDHEMMWFTAHLAPAGAGKTKVTIELQKTEGGKEYYMGDYFVPRPALEKPVRPAIEEAIAAVLEKRKFQGQDLPRGDSVCDVQRGAIDSGHIFSVNDKPGDDWHQID